MAKKENAIYAPGELSRVREKLGVKNDEEAKRMAQVLGGEVGTERTPEPEQTVRKSSVRRETVELMVGGKGGRSPGRRIDVAGDEDDARTAKIRARLDVFPGDDPTVPVKQNYRERVKIDQYAGQLTFEIKTSLQVLVSVFSFFREPTDYVNQRFVTRRMNEYYHKIEKLVTAARTLFPKSNTKRINQLKRTSSIIYKIVETLRSWNIEQIANNMADLQAHPRIVRVTDFTEILQDIYKPLFILADLNTEHIKQALKLVYKILYIESPMEAKEKYQDVIRNVITSLVDVRRDIQFGMYPLLMKLISNRYIPYERFFTERRRCYMAFLNVTQAEQLNASELTALQVETLNVEELQKGADEEQVEEELPTEEELGEPEEIVEEEDLNDPEVIARRAKEDAEKAEKKALEQGLSVLEALFPKAGWEKLGEFPDLYPYFANVYNLKHGFELLSPKDALQQTSILMHILDDLFIAMRYVNFGTIVGPDGRPLKVNEEVNEITNNWRSYIENSFSKDYLPRLTEYCRILENSKESRLSAYARKIINELNWIKRLYFLPYYKFESMGPPPFTKQDVLPIYGEIRKLRKHLTSVAMGIDQGTHAGGAAAKAPCEGINNPWESYNFQVPNPVSRRLDLLLPPERKINASLIYFSLSAVTVLDFIVNNENSWAYATRGGTLFRSVRDEGVIPVFGVDEKLDADKMFRESLKKKAQTV